MIERLPDHVMLDDFERLLSMSDPSDNENDDQNFGVLFELAKFIDENGQRLLLLARTCINALERQSKTPI